MPVLELIPGELEVEAPFQEVQEGAWASEAYLDACCREGMVVVRVEAQHHQPEGLVPLHLEAWALQGALLEALIQEEEQGGNQEVACLAWAFQFLVQLGLASGQLVVGEHLQTADVACLPGREGFVRPRVALQLSHVFLLLNPS